MAKLRVKMESLARDNVGSVYNGYELALTDIEEDKVNEIYRKDNATFALRQINPAVDKCSMSITALKTLADAIDRSTYYGNYRDVKDDNEWLRLYDQSSRYVTVKFGNKWEKAYAVVIPCYYCGFAVPRGVIEVDHWFEKGSANDMIQALLKVFRSLGDQLTVAGPSGDKGSQTAAIMSGLGVNTIGTRNNGPLLDAGRLNSRRANFADAKRQLSDKGRLVLSTFFVAWGGADTDGFLKLFINNFFNLVPACGACNKAKNRRV